MKNNFWNIHYTYATELSFEQCCKRISSPPFLFGDDPHNREEYRYEQISSNQFVITFCGAQFGRFRRTEYLFSFIKTSENNIIHVDFQHEILGLMPMTSEDILSDFMKEILCASPVLTKEAKK